MKRVAVFGKISQFESFVNDPEISVIQVTVNSCQQSYNFQECFIGVVFYEDAALKTTESPTTTGNIVSPKLRDLVAILKGSPTISTTAVLKVLYSELPQLSGE